MNQYIDEVIGRLGGVIHLDDRRVESFADFLLGLLQLQPGDLRRLDLIGEILHVGKAQAVGIQTLLNFLFECGDIPLQFANQHFLLIDGLVQRLRRVGRIERGGFCFLS